MVGCVWPDGFHREGVKCGQRWKRHVGHLNEWPSMEGGILETEMMPQWERMCPATIMYIVLG